MMSVKSVFSLTLTAVFAFCCYLSKCNADECANLIGKYTMSTNLKDRRSFSSPLSTLTDSSTTECAVACEEMFLCGLFFHNPPTRRCDLHTREVANTKLDMEAGSLGFVADDAEELWLQNIVSSSPGNLEPAANMIGLPDAKFWLPPENQPAFAELRFDSELLIELIHIYEMDYAGGVSTISFLTPGGTWYPVWVTAQLEVLSFRIWSPDLEVTHFTTSSVRIDIGARSVYTRIDAVQVIGKQRRLTTRVKST